MTGDTGDTGQTSQTSEIDVETLRSELTSIKDAMGIEERYPSQNRSWLIFGVAVAVASGVSQYVLLADLPPFYFSATWIVAMVAAYAAQYRFTERPPRDATGAKPNPIFQFGAIFVGAVAIAFAVSATFDQIDARLSTTVVFSVLIGLVGVGYLVLGNTLKAYYIRRRDRVAFYVGGAWMLALALAAPHVEFLLTWSWTVYGALFLAHSLVSYAVLSRPD